MNSTLLFATYKYRGTHPGPCGLLDLKLQSSWLLELLICYKLSFNKAFHIRPQDFFLSLSNGE